MIARKVFVLGMVAAFTFLATSLVQAEESTVTTISVKGMHCAGCASKVASKLDALAGVQKSKVDAEKSVAIVTPKPKSALSPKALWEAVEKAGYEPIKLVGPSGTFTEKPKS